MPFDFQNNPTPACHIGEIETLSNIALGFYEPRSTVARRRSAALEALAIAKRHEDDPLIDWRELAEALGACIPVPRAKAKAAGPDPVWAEHKTIGRHQDREITSMTFADGSTVPVSLLTPKGKSLADYARACRMAVRFYRSKRSGCWGGDGIPVPPFTHAAGADLAKANEHTKDMREPFGDSARFRAPEIDHEKAAKVWAAVNRREIEAAEAAAYYHRLEAMRFDKGRDRGPAAADPYGARAALKALADGEPFRSPAENRAAFFARS